MSAVRALARAGFSRNSNAPHPPHAHTHTKYAFHPPQGKVEIRPIMYLALTYDHRLVDGREAVTFLASVRDKVEDPRRLLLGL